VSCWVYIPVRKGEKVGAIPQKSSKKDATKRDPWIPQQTSHVIGGKKGIFIKTSIRKMEVQGQSRKKP
jgi:hypothetical protein